MANPNGTPRNLKRVPKGGPSPNPNGRPPDALNAAMKKLTKVELEEIANLIIKGTLADLEALMKSKQTTVIKAMIAGVAVKTIKNGDHSALNTLLDRLIGKVKEQHHFTGVQAAPPATVVVNIPSNGREAKKK